MCAQVDKQVVSIHEIVRAHFCARTGQGELVFQEINKLLEQDKPVSLSFKNITQATPTFLNAAIGQLYSKFSENKIKQLLSVQDIKAYEVSLLSKVVDNAKQFVKNKENNNAK